MKLVIFLMFFTLEAHAKNCVVQVCNSLLPKAKCYRKVIRHSGRIHLPTGYFIVGGCRETKDAKE